MSESMSHSKAKYADKIEQLELFRQRKAAEKLDRHERIQKRIHELQDLRRAAIARTQAEMISCIATNRSSPRLLASRRSTIKSSSKLVESVTKPDQKVQLSARAKLAASRLKASGRFGSGNVKPAVVRRLTVTLAESDADIAGQGPVELMDCDDVSAANDENSPVRSRRRSTVILGKRPTALQGVFPAIKKSKMELIEEVDSSRGSNGSSNNSKSNAGPRTSLAAPNLTRQEQLLIWRQKRQASDVQNKTTANQTLQDRRKTLAVLRAVPPTNQASSSVLSSAGTRVNSKPVAFVRPNSITATRSVSVINPKPLSDRRRSVMNPSVASSRNFQPAQPKTVQQNLSALTRPRQTSTIKPVTTGGGAPTYMSLYERGRSTVMQAANNGMKRSETALLSGPADRRRTIAPTHKPALPAGTVDRRRTIAPARKSPARNGIVNRRRTIAPTGVQPAAGGRIQTRRSSFGVKRGGVATVTTSAKKPLQVKRMTEPCVIGTTAITSSVKKPSLVKPAVQTCSTVINSTMKEIGTSPITIDNNQRVSTPVSCRRIGTAGGAASLSAAVTPSLSAIPRCKTVSFLESTGGRRNTPRLTRTPVLTKEMSMREKLSKWLASRGKTPSRYRHMMCFGHGHFDTTGSSSVEKKKANVSRHSVSKELARLNLSADSDNEDEKVDNDDNPAATMTTESSECGQEPLENVSEQLAGMFQECMMLLRAGFPANHLATWLDEMSQRVPEARRLPGYWLCKARVAAKCTNDNGNEAVSVVDEGVSQNAETVDDLMPTRSTLERTLNESQTLSVSHVTSRQRRLSEVQSENVFDSSTVKLCLRRKSNSSATPQQTIAVPVRRSTRRSCAALPSALRDHDVIVESLDELPAESCATMLFKDNIALKLEWHLTKDGAAETQHIAE